MNKDLYYILLYNQSGTVKQCKTLIRHGHVFVNNEMVKDPKYKVKDSDQIICHGKTIDPDPFVYYMFNKPEGYICANRDKTYPCVIDFFENKDLIMSGRLDIDTTGLLILSNDKSLKKLLLPQNHIDKTYLVEVKECLKKEDIEAFQEGIIIDKNTKLKEAILEIIDDYHCFLTISEGKYHQIKKMFLSIDNKVIHLHRISFGPVVLDPSLKKGTYRKLNKEEKTELLKLVENIKERKKENETV